MAKQKNPNIGVIKCPICQRLSAVRKASSGKYYFDCLECGRITPNMPGGQEWVLQHAKIWGASGKPPAGIPRWITEQLSWREAVIADRIERGEPAAAPVAAGPATSAPAPAPAQPPPPPPDPPEPPAPRKPPDPPRGGFSFME